MIQKIPKKLLKRAFWKGLKAEYKKIIWPDKETVTKQTGAVIAVSVALGLIIAALDTAYRVWTALRYVKAKVRNMAEANWYVVHTYSGYENKVKVDIEKTIENRNLQDQILEVSVPMQEVIEVKNGAQ